MYVVASCFFVGVPVSVRVESENVTPFMGGLGVSVYVRSPLPPVAAGSVTVPIDTFFTHVMSRIVDVPKVGDVSGAFDTAIVCSVVLSPNHPAAPRSIRQRNL